MGRFRTSSWGSGAIILAFLLLLFHRYGDGLLFLVIGAALLWYGRRQREARERDASERGNGNDAPVTPTPTAPEERAGADVRPPAGDDQEGR